MIDLILTAIMYAPAQTTPDAPTAGKPTTSTIAERRDDRPFSIQRPSRGAARKVSVVQKAATFPRSILPFARCVIQRESGADIDRRQSGVGARNPSSSASGRWQFLDTSWRDGLSFMVKDRLVRFGMPKDQAKEIRNYLASTPISRWHGLYQDIGFIEVNQRGGSYHWRLAGSRCEAFR